MSPGIFFTFHNVSIKSQLLCSLGARFFPLHSTMYLLNHTERAVRAALFLTLHSTMYLLNPNESRADYTLYHIFTFHNVSIKSSAMLKFLRINHHFTFHNVSIKSMFSFVVTDACCLYIPQCIY